MIFLKAEEKKMYQMSNRKRKWNDGRTIKKVLAFEKEQFHKLKIEKKINDSIWLEGELESLFVEIEVKNGKITFLAVNYNYYLDLLYEKEYNKLQHIIEWVLCTTKDRIRLLF